LKDSLAAIRKESSCQTKYNTHVARSPTPTNPTSLSHRSESEAKVEEEQEQEQEEEEDSQLDPSL